jgi:malate dehydrogenase (oxaloacetate-decarboxylating)
MGHHVPCGGILQAMPQLGQGKSESRRRIVLDFRTSIDEETGEGIVEVPVSGPALLYNSVFNKGSAFSEEERTAFGLHGLLPPHVGSLDEQLKRRLDDFHEKRTALQQHVYLRDLQDRNETLFYAMLHADVREMMPLIYTPVVGEACAHFSHIFRKPRGLYIAYEHRDKIDVILSNRLYEKVDVIVVTDGERVLGLGDLGVGGMGIPVGKLSLYTLCGGVPPWRTLPIYLDTGTDNPQNLSDPVYLGSRHERLRGQVYDDFIELFVGAVRRALPGVLLQWEDFALANAHRLLDRYRDRLCSFNDDIQGTAAVTLAVILAAGRVARTRLADQRIAILGAGSAATGIADLLVSALCADGLNERAALDRVWLVNRQGLLHTGLAGLAPFQARFARSRDDFAGWTRTGGLDLAAVIENVRPTVLIGTSGQPGMFTEPMVRSMARHVARPAIFPLSNPTSRCEANPADLLTWSEGRALVATGSPFEDVVLAGKRFPIAQCNNSYIFPGVGQGVIASGARRVTDAMFMAAARSLAGASPAQADPTAPLLPPLEQIVPVSRRVAAAVAAEAQAEGLIAPCSPDDLERRIAARWWEPRYRRMRPAR